ncbi:unnamed protein product [Effrenium voratum]|uniref:Epidermal growth factor receptor substrate 15 n=1 Tax=Effrenium voratum TaxID=2562239 RepID=A0AA36MV95_9DINO|nr:unnamed protein product [Effrenium voratum]
MGVAFHDAEKELYAELFASAADGDGWISGQRAAEVLQASGLPQDVLFEIWGLADEAQAGALDLERFGVALRLIAHAQSGLPVSAELVHQEPFAPPRFEGPQETQGQGPDSNERELYAGFFGQLAHGDRIPGKEAYDFLCSSGLPWQSLQDIWHLADEQQQGFLGFESFGVALRLVAHCQAQAAPTRELVYQEPLSPPIFDREPQRPFPDAPSATEGGPTARQLRKYGRLFCRTVARWESSLGGQAARELFLLALPEERLPGIWGLSDIDGDGQLRWPEFVLAMHLIRLARLGQELAEVPDALRAAVNALAPAPSYAAQPSNSPRSLSPARGGSAFDVDGEGKGQNPLGPAVRNRDLPVLPEFQAPEVTEVTEVKEKEKAKKEKKKKKKDKDLEDTTWSQEPEAFGELSLAPDPFSTWPAVQPEPAGSPEAQGSQGPPGRFPLGSPSGSPTLPVADPFQTEAGAFAEAPDPFETEVAMKEEFDPFGTRKLSQPEVREEPQPVEHLVALLEEEKGLLRRARQDSVELREELLQLEEACRREEKAAAAPDRGETASRQLQRQLSASQGQLVELRAEYDLLRRESVFLRQNQTGSAAEAQSLRRLLDEYRRDVQVLERSVGFLESAKSSLEAQKVALDTAAARVELQVRTEAARLAEDQRELRVLRKALESLRGSPKAEGLADGFGSPGVGQMQSHWSSGISMLDSPPDRSWMAGRGGV